MQTVCLHSTLTMQRGTARVARLAAKHVKMLHFAQCVSLDTS